MITEENAKLDNALVLMKSMIQFVVITERLIEINVKQLVTDKTLILMEFVRLVLAHLVVKMLLDIIIIQMKIMSIMVSINLMVFENNFNFFVF